MRDIRAAKVYHLGVKSRVKLSYKMFKSTSSVNTLGAIRRLEANWPDNV